MALKLALDKNGIRVIDDITNFIETRHNSSGGEDIIPLYIFNDGKRFGMASDENPPALIYTNSIISIEGVMHRLQEPAEASTGKVSLQFDSTEGWNIGTLIWSNGEVMRIQKLETNGTGVVVQRRYDGGLLMKHNVNDQFITDTKGAFLGTPDPANYDDKQSISWNQTGGTSLTTGLDPTYLAQSVNSLPQTTLIKSTSGVKYHPKSLIKIDNEIMRVDSINGNDLTVTRGFDGTEPAQHNQNAKIFCVGFVDVMTGNSENYTHLFYLKVVPPTGLPTQKKRDLKLSLVADEAAL